LRWCGEAARTQGGRGQSAVALASRFGDRDVPNLSRGSDTLEKIL